MATRLLFLCSYFSSVASFLGTNDDVFAEQGSFAGRNVVFIPTASIHEEYNGYVGEARQAWESLGAEVSELEISTASGEEIKYAMERAEIVYVSGGNSFFLIDCMRSRGVDELIRQRIDDGLFYVGESAGAIIAGPDIAYIEAMDSIPDAYSQADYKGLGLIEDYVVPHYLDVPFEEVSRKIVDKYSELSLRTLTNKQALIVNGDDVRLVEA